MVSVDASNSADSAGQTWSGRSLRGTGFDDDFGVADPRLMSALAEQSDESGWMAALSQSRLMVPIVAAPGEIDDSGDHPVEKTTDMAVVTLTAPDGRRALPVFTGLESMRVWDPSARPSPVKSALAAQAAISEQCDVIVLDVSSPHSVVLRASMVWALAQQQTWQPAHEDPFVHRAVERAAGPHDAVRRVECAAGDAAGVLRIVLYLDAGLDAGQVQALATDIGETIATDGEVRARIDAVAFAIRPAAE